jgi:hypothetical protein
MYPEGISKAIWSCIQEKPTKFMSYTLYDPGAYPKPPICRKITLRITEPWRPDISEEQSKVLEGIKKATQARGKKEREKNDSELLEFLGLKKKQET